MNLLVTGASGQLGAYLLDHLEAAGQRVTAWSRAERVRRGSVELLPVDLTDSEATRLALDKADPGVVIHAAALSAAEAVRLDPVGARLVNVASTQRIADWCGSRGRRLVFTSTDLVFDGSSAWNRETDPAAPVLAYGQTKSEAEPVVLAVPGGVVARLPLLFGPSRCGRPYFFTRAIEALHRGQSQTFFEDEFRTPLHLSTAALFLRTLALSDVSGLFHVAGAERVSRFELMTRAATTLGLDSRLIQPNRRADAKFAEPRPADVSLATDKLLVAFPDLDRPSIEQALKRGFENLGGS